MSSEAILQVKDLKVYFFGDESVLRAVDGVSYTLHKGECMAIIGESGSGKSVSALSLLRLISFPPGLIINGEILLHGEDLMKYDDDEIQKIRGAKISMIFQEPSTSLNPVMTIGAQIVENITAHTDLGKDEAWKEAISLLEKVGIPAADKRVHDYPFQFSGGMQQRAMIAMAMSCRPEILIADEPTTALDVTVQAQVLEQLDNLRRELGTALILITHNLGVVARYADVVRIMYGGRIVEEGTTEEIFRNPHHPYTLGLIRAVPRLDQPKNEEGLYAIQGEPPDMNQTPPNCCAFWSRCKYACDRCRSERPELVSINEKHSCACFCQDATQEEREALI